MKRRIIVGGAGLSGLATATALAQSGWPVTVFERRSDVGLRFKGDLQGLENWTLETDVMEEIRAWGIKGDWWVSPVNSFAVLGPEGMEPMSFSGSRPVFYLVRRGPDPGDIDATLRDTALTLGVEIKFGQSISEKEADVVAWGPRTTSGLAYGYTFNTDSPDRAVMVCDDNVAPKGYGYLLIADGFGRLSTVFRDDFAAGSKKYLELLETRLMGYSPFAVRDKNIFGARGAFSIDMVFCRGGAKVVGEASGLQDFLFGFGMRLAISSGVLAAESLINQDSYDEMAAEKYGAMARTSLVNRYVYEKLGNRGYSAVLSRLAKQGADPVAVLRRVYSPSWKRRLLYPWVKRHMKGRISVGDNGSLTKDAQVLQWG